MAAARRCLAFASVKNSKTKYYLLSGAMQPPQPQTPRGHAPTCGHPRRRHCRLHYANRTSNTHMTPDGHCLVAAPVEHNTHNTDTLTGVGATVSAPCGGNVPPKRLTQSKHSARPLLLYRTSAQREQSKRLQWRRRPPFGTIGFTS
jgi:hypothetical protein